MVAARNNCAEDFWERFGMMELLTNFVELAALDWETRARPVQRVFLYKRCRETLNGSLSRVKDAGRNDAVAALAPA
jgi:hypothetical protein